MKRALTFLAFVAAAFAIVGVAVAQDSYGIQDDMRRWQEYYAQQDAARARREAQALRNQQIASCNAARNANLAAMDEQALNAYNATTDEAERTSIRAAYYSERAAVFQAHATCLQGVR